MLKTALTDLLEIEHPVIQGGMAWVATWELVTAVSQAGGLGVLGAGNAPVDWVEDQIEHIIANTDVPYGVNVPLFSPYVEGVMNLCMKKHVPVVTTGAGNPTPYIAPLKEAGVRVIPVVASSALARRLERVGADAVIAEGEESGGHIGSVSTLALVPRVVDAVEIPVIAAGGFGDGRGLAAALVLGADGVQMGTRFICSEECTVHPDYKETILRANERSTIVTGLSVGHPVRCIRNPMTRRFEELEKKGIDEEDIMEFGAGKLRLAAREGDMVEGSIMAGQVCGLINEILPAGEIVLRTVSEAKTALQRVHSLAFV
ncbi:MAG: nitronate monooxygenase [Chloroflexota bacterium]|nr:nitronate monooxygenase [Chloroflexota bacterium]